MTVGEMLQQELGGVLVELEGERRRRTGIILKWGVSLAAAALAMAVWFRVADGSWLAGVFAALFALLVWLFIASGQSSRYSGSFKALVMPELVRTLGEELEYHPGGWLGETEFRESGLFMAPDCYSGSDLVTGYVGETHIRS